MLLQTNSYIVPKEKRAEHSRLIRRFRQTLLRLGCDHFEVYEQVGSNWSNAESAGRYVQILRFLDRKHQLAVQAAERSDPTAQAVIADFCDLINFPYQQLQGLFAVGFYTSVLPVQPKRGARGELVSTVEHEVINDPEAEMPYPGASDGPPLEENASVEDSSPAGYAGANHESEAEAYGEKTETEAEMQHRSNEPVESVESISAHDEFLENEAEAIAPIEGSPLDEMLSKHSAEPELEELSELGEPEAEETLHHSEHALQVSESAPTPLAHESGLAEEMHVPEEELNLPEAEVHETDNGKHLTGPVLVGGEIAPAEIHDEEPMSLVGADLHGIHHDETLRATHQDEDMDGATNGSHHVAPPAIEPEDELHEELLEEEDDSANGFIEGELLEDEEVHVETIESIEHHEARDRPPGW